MSGYDVQDWHACIEQVHLSMWKEWPTNRPTNQPAFPPPYTFIPSFTSLYSSASPCDWLTPSIIMHVYPYRLTLSTTCFFDHPLHIIHGKQLQPKSLLDFSLISCRVILSHFTSLAISRILNANVYHLFHKQQSGFEYIWAFYTHTCTHQYCLHARIGVLSTIIYINVTTLVFALIGT